MLAAPATSSTISTVTTQRWTIQQLYIFLPWAMQLFNKESELYLASSFEKGVLRSDPKEEDLLLFRDVVSSYISADNEKSATELSQLLRKNMPHLSTDQIMICWGALIKTSLKQAEIIDLNDVAVEKYHENFIKHLVKITKKSEEKAQKLIQPCFETFFKKLDEIGHYQSAYVMRTYLKLYKLIAREWLAAMDNDHVQLCHSLGVYLGPGLLYSLKLNSRLITKPREKSAATLEFMFMQQCTMALLREEQEYMEVGMPAVTYNPLYGVDLSRLRSPKLTAVTAQEQSAVSDSAKKVRFDLH